MKYNNNPNAYINAQALEVAIVKTTTYGDALNALRKAPSIDIVRCRDCKKWNGMYCFLGYATHAPKADDFCSYGCREEE